MQNKRYTKLQIVHHVRCNFKTHSFLYNTLNIFRNCATMIRLFFVLYFKSKHYSSVNISNPNRDAEAKYI